MNRGIAICAAAAIAVFGSRPSGAQVTAAIVPTTNPAASLFQRIGVTDVQLGYSRPAVKGRTIFGGLVPFGEVWRTGADNATRVSFSTDVSLNGAPVPAGEYELFTIPREKEWTIIIQNRQKQWGSYSYDTANDVVRVAAIPQTLAEPVESFTLVMSDVSAKHGVLNILWDRTRVPINIDVDVVKHAVPRIEAAMQSPDHRPYFLAAMFYFENDLDINKAVEYINAAVAEQPKHLGMIHRQALILEKAGDKAGALVAAQRSMELAQLAGRELKEEYTRLNRALIARLGQP